MIIDCALKIERKFEQQIETAIDCLRNNSEFPAAVSGVTMSAEKRKYLIAEAAYFRAEQRGFAGGVTEQDWLRAEAMIDCLLDALAGKLKIE